MSGAVRAPARTHSLAAPARSRPPAALIGLLCLALAGLATLLIRHETGMSGDEPYYARIANHPAGPHNFPYAFRIGVPYLVHVLPFSHSFSWELLALLAAAGAGAAMYALLLEFATDWRLAAGLALALTVSPPLLVVFLRGGRELDAATILLITLGTLFIVRRNHVGLFITLLAGITVHEACLFLIPFSYAVWAERPFDREALGEMVKVAAVPVILYAYLRSSVIAVDEAYQPGYTGSILGGRIDVLRDALREGGWARELRRMAVVYGPLWLAAPFALRDLRFARRGLVLVGLTVLSMTFALDWGRAIFFAAPVFYVAAAHAVRHRRALAIALVALTLTLDLSYGVYMQVHGVRHDLDSTAPPARGPVH